ncbi:MAG TPA: universal stress protein [Galbitalea sp.]|jgi:nucleotide-binding universal stress UspA family protein|nr:universal stress protein [Galbitalea sp.]
MNAEQSLVSGTAIVVGVVGNQPDEVLLQAANFASHFNAELVFATVDMTRYTVAEAPDGSVSAFPIDPDAAELTHEEFDPELASRVKDILDGIDVKWSLRALAGDPAHELSRLAERLDAALIVVGTRHEGFSGGLREFFTGSVAVHLAHRQHRPVVVIPLSPLPHGSHLPWGHS